MIKYLNLEGFLSITIGAPDIVFYVMTLILLSIKAVMAFTRIRMVIFDIYYRFIRLTNPQVVQGSSKRVNLPVKQIGKPRKFTTSSCHQSKYITPLNKSRLYMRVLDTVKPVGAMLGLKSGRPLVNHLLRMVNLIGLGMSKGLVKVIVVYCYFCFKHIKASGLPGLIIYLKACTVILQQASGGHRLYDMSPLKVRFSRNKCGLPKVIPQLHRTRIRQGDVILLKLWMTLFSIYRVLEMPYKLDLKTITSPSTMDSSILPEFSRYLKEGFFPSLESLSGFDDTKIGQNLGEPFGILKSLRATPFTISKSSSAAGMIKFSDSDNTPLSTSPAGIFAATATWYEHPEYKQNTLEAWCQATGNIWLLNRMEQ